MRYVNLLLILFSVGLSVSSQTPDSTNHYSIGFQAHYGFIIPHSASISSISKTNPIGLEISLNNLKTSYKSWSIFNRYNISGIQFNYFNFQNPQILGSAYTLTLFTEPILTYGDKIRFSVKGGAGLSYHTKIYRFDENELNKFFSTSISFPLYLSARVKYSINESTNLILSGTYNHISNGAMRIPNYGMNFPTATIGMEYFPKRIPRLDRSFTPPLNNKVSASYILIQVLTGYKVVWGVDTYAYGVSSRYTRQLRARYALNAGAELIVDGGVNKMIEVQGLNLDHKRVAIIGGQDFILGKVIFSQLLGVYIYAPYKAKHPVYQKYELSYKVFPDILAGVYLKAHTSDAELFGFSLNYLIHL